MNDCYITLKFVLNLKEETLINIHKTYNLHILSTFMKDTFPYTSAIPLNEYPVRTIGEVLQDIDLKLQKTSNRKQLIFLFADNLDSSKLEILSSLRVLAEVFYVHQSPVNPNLHRHFTGILSRKIRRDLDMLEVLIERGSEFCFQRRQFVKTKIRVEKPFDLKKGTRLEVRFIKHKSITQLKFMVIENGQFKGSIHDIFLNNDDEYVNITLETKSNSVPEQFLRYVILSKDVQTIYDEGQLEFRASDLLGSIKEPLGEVKIGLISGHGDPCKIFDTVFTLLDEINCVSNRSGRMSYISMNTPELQIFQTSNNMKLYCLHVTENDPKQKAKELIEKVDCLLVDLPFSRAHYVGEYIQEMAQAKGILFHMTLTPQYADNRNNSKLINYSFQNWEFPDEHDSLQVFNNGIKLSQLIQPLIEKVLDRRTSSIICMFLLFLLCIRIFTALMNYVAIVQ